MDAVRIILEKTPPEISSDIIDSGIYITGGSANIKKIDLDVPFYTNSDWIYGGFTHEGGVCTLSDEPGLGITVEGF